MRSSKAPPSEGGSEGLLDAIEGTVRRHASDWFPDLDGPRPAVREVAREDRPRCYLYRVTIDDGRRSQRVVVKVRHSVPRLRRADRFPDRPILAPERTIPDREAARREYDGLRLIEHMLGSVGTAAFGVLRPLAWLDEHAAIVMPEVTDPTLRTHLLRRPNPLGIRADRGARLVPWRNAGGWLRRFHDAPTDLPLRERHTSRAEIIALVESYRDFLTERVGRAGFFARMAEVAVERIGHELPDRLPAGTGHGDFVTRNMFTSPRGRVTVLDPMPLWRTPVYEDMGRLLTVGLRLIDIQSYTQGLVFGERELAAYETAFLTGYYRDEPVPYRAVHAYQLLVLLDRWSAKVSKDGLHGRRTRRAFFVALSGRHFGHEVQRLVDLLQRRAGSEGRVDARRLRDRS